MKLIPIPTTNLWVAVSYPDRRGNNDLVTVVLFQDNKLVRKRRFTTVAVRDGHYIGLLAFNPARCAVEYRTEYGFEQYDILSDRILSPPEDWREEKIETLKGLPRDRSAPASP